MSSQKIIPIFAASVGFCHTACDNSAQVGSSESTSTSTAAPAPVARSIEEQLIEPWTYHVHGARQNVFNAIHPIGKAVSSQVHQVEVKWKNDQRTNRLEDIELVGVRFTIFWEGPINKDGYTKLFCVYDPEIDRITGTEILATNGITNDEFAEGVGYAIGLGVAASMEGE